MGSKSTRVRLFSTILYNYNYWNPKTNKLYKTNIKKEKIIIIFSFLEIDSLWVNFKIFFIDMIFIYKINPCIIKYVPKITNQPRLSKFHGYNNIVDIKKKAAIRQTHANQTDNKDNIKICSFSNTFFII